MSKNVILILASDDTIKRGVCFISKIVKRTVLDQHTVDSGGVSWERSVYVAVGTSTAHKKSIHASICIGRESQCGIFTELAHHVLHSCLCVCDVAKHSLPDVVETLSHLVEIILSSPSP